MFLVKYKDQATAAFDSVKSATGGLTGGSGPSDVPPNTVSPFGDGGNQYQEGNPPVENPPAPQSQPGPAPMQQGAPAQNQSPRE